MSPILPLIQQQTNRHDGKINVSPVLPAYQVHLIKLSQAGWINWCRQICGIFPAINRSNPKQSQNNDSILLICSLNSWFVRSLNKTTWTFQMHVYKSLAPSVQDWLWLTLRLLHQHSNNITRSFSHSLLKYLNATLIFHSTQFTTIFYYRSEAYFRKNIQNPKQHVWVWLFKTKNK